MSYGAIKQQVIVNSRIPVSPYRFGSVTYSAGCVQWNDEMLLEIHKS